MQIQQAKNESTGSEQYGTSRSAVIIYLKSAMMGR